MELSYRHDSQPLIQHVPHAKYRCRSRPACPDSNTELARTAMDCMHLCRCERDSQGNDRPRSPWRATTRAVAHETFQTTRPRGGQ